MSRAGQLSVRTVVIHLYEIVKLHSNNRLSCDEYYRYEFHTDRYSWDEKKSFITRNLCIEIPNQLNDPSYNILTDDKLIFKRYFSNAGIPVPELLGVFDPRVGFVEGGGSLRTEEDLKRWIHAAEYDSPVFKPMRGLQGEGILVFRGRDAAHRDILLHVDGEKYDAHRIYEHLTRWEYKGVTSFLIEKRVEQHPQLNSLNPSVAHTLRIMTLGLKNGEIQIVGAAFRLGIGDQGIDNVSVGNISVAIDDLESGLLGYGVMGIDDRYETVTTHPTSDVEFVGLRIPFWQEAKVVAIGSAHTLPHSPWMGWDIGIGAEGPVLIEGNEIWGPMQLASGKGVLTPQLRRQLASQGITAFA